MGKRAICYLLAALFLSNPITALAELSYTTTWVGNTYGTEAAHVGNCARSMWIAPEGVVYTATMWDENGGGIAIYQNGQTIGSIGAHGEMQGGAITGNATSVFAALQFNTTLGGSGYVGRFNRARRARDLVISVSETRTERRADVITGLAISGTLLYASDLPGNRVRVFTTEGMWQQDIAVSSPGALAVDGAGNIWVAQMSAGTILEFSPSGTALIPSRWEPLPVPRRCFSMPSAHSF